MDMERYTQVLKKHHLSNTLSRRTLFAILVTRGEPLTMRQLVNAAAPTLDRSTVYRCIELFESIGIVNKVYTGWKYRVELSEAFTHHHHHFTCMVCGEIISFEETPAFTNFLTSTAQANNFQLKSHTLELRGTCKNCTT